MYANSEVTVAKLSFRSRLPYASEYAAVSTWNVRRYCEFDLHLADGVQENAELRQQHSAAEEKSRKADDRQRADAYKQVLPQPHVKLSCTRVFRLLTVRTTQVQGQLQLCHVLWQTADQSAITCSQVFAASWSAEVI